jgi:hypothetical protein
MITLLLPALGTGILLLLAGDVFITVFHPEGHGGPLTQRHNSAVWWVWKKVAPAGRWRDGWLGVGGPALAVLTPALWALLLVLGFALLYYPWIDRFLVSPGSLRAHWAEAFYFSGFTAATLGTGDIVPDLVALRVLSILQALSGFALLSAALSYILAIYRENGRKTTLASDLALHYRIGHAGDSPPSLQQERERWLEHVARELIHLIQAHAQYPILHYFRGTDPRNSITLQLAPLIDLARSTRPAATRPGGSTPGAALVSGALERYLAASDRRFVRGHPASSSDDDLDQKYRRLLGYLAYDPEEVAGLER